MHSVLYYPVGQFACCAPVPNYQCIAGHESSLQLPKKAKKSVHIHAHKLTHKLLEIPVRIDTMFKQPIMVSTFSICTLIRLKCFLSQAACCGQSASDSRCPCVHIHMLTFYT